jgi:MFS family permease
LKVGVDPELRAGAVIADPDDHASRRPFYGWLIVAACFGILFVAYGVQFSYGVFLPAMAAETGWDRTSLSLAFSLYVFVYSILGAASGWCTDRFGPRLVVGCGAVLLGGGLILTSRVDALWQLYLSLGLIAALGMSAIYVPATPRWSAGSSGAAAWPSASPRAGTASAISCCHLWRPF